MLNRRHLRIKILQALYAYQQSDNQNYTAGEKELIHSIEKMYDLYILYFLILPELKILAERKIEEGKRRKFIVTESAEVNRNFVDNRFLSIIEENFMLQDKSNELKLNWVGDVNQDLLKKLFQHVIDSDIYKAYMALPNPDFEQQKIFIIKLFRKVICNFGILLNHFEEMRIHWQDDFDHVFGMIIKTMKTFNEQTDENAPIFELYKDDEKEFSKKLFRRAVANFENNEKLLGAYTKNWDSERLAKMDTLIMILAITEAKEFPTIPINVTMNEYLEISKFYSTPKSSNFINGVLDKVFKDLKSKGEIKKVGRGLV